LIDQVYKRCKDPTDDEIVSLTIGIVTRSYENRVFKVLL